MTPHLYDLSICIITIRHRNGMIKREFTFFSPLVMPFISIPLRERYTKKTPMAIPRNNFFNMGMGSILWMEIRDQILEVRTNKVCPYPLISGYLFKQVINHLVMQALRRGFVSEHAHSDGYRS